MCTSKERKADRATGSLIPTTWHFGKGKTIERIKISVVARGWREG
jgi:hypothetical protein